MAWIESHTVLRNHRKTLIFKRALGVGLAQATGHLHLLWHAALEQQENGDLSSWPDDLIAEISAWESDPKTYVTALQTAGFLDGKIIHDWWTYVGRFLQTKYKQRPERWKLIKECCLNGSKNAPNNAPENIQPNLTKPNLTKPKVNTVCAEPRKSCAPAPSIPDELAGLDLYRQDIALVKAWPELIVAWKKAFPGIDIASEVSRAHAWEISNPEKRKIRRARFLQNWLSRSQDRGGKNGAGNGNSKPHFGGGDNTAGTVGGEKYRKAGFPE